MLRILKSSQMPFGNLLWNVEAPLDVEKARR